MNSKRILSVLSLAVAIFATGCMTPGQNQVALQIGAGEGIGTNLLKKNSTNGVVNPAYLAQYESEIPNVAGLMQGKLTPADLHNILSAENTAGVSTDKLTAIGILNGVDQEWIKVNQGTPDGALADSAAKNVAIGLGNAVGLVTGVNYTPTTAMFVTPRLHPVETEITAFRFVR